MIVKNAVLQILDLSRGIKLISNTSLDLNDEVIYEYLDKILKRIVTDPNKRRGFFNPASPFLENYDNYKSQKLGFVDYAKNITEDISKVMFEEEDKKGFDLLMVNFIEDSIEYFGIIFLDSKEAITHLVENSDNGPANTIIKNKAILPTSSVTIHTYAYISLSDDTIYSKEKPRQISGKEMFVLKDYLSANYGMSNNESFRVIKSITNELCIEQGENNAVTMCKVKSYLNSLEDTSKVNLTKMADEVFEKPEERELFNNLVKKNELPEINFDKNFLIKKTNNHTIKTDNGFEISFPVEDSLSDSIEFLNEADGTISIKLKRINKIINR